MQAVGSWSVDACCAVPGNDCHHSGGSAYGCTDRASSSDWLFGLWPGPPQRFEPTGTNTAYQTVGAGEWPQWGGNGSGDDLAIVVTSYAPDVSHGTCQQGGTYRGTHNEICGGEANWGATDVEVWYPR